MSRQTQQIKAQTSQLPTGATGVLHRKCVTCGNHTLAKDKCAEHEKQTGQLQREVVSHNQPEGVPPIVYDVLNSSGKSLDTQMQTFFEPKFGHDFSGVRVHTDAKAAQSVKAVNALAYTVGNSIVFGEGQYAPQTRSGSRILAHELAHVVQQGGQAGIPTGAISLTSPHDTSEGEADRAADKVISGEAPSAQTHSGLALAREMDAGVSPDSGVMDSGAALDGGMSDGPRDAGPIAGAPAPAPGVTPAAPAPPLPVTASIAPVTFRGTVNRVAPTQTADVAFTVNNLPASSSATIDVEGSGGANGTATITAGATLSGSGKVTVRGGTQTAPGKAGSLKIRASVGGTVVGRSPGFTVAAYPISYTDTFVSDINDGTRLGLVVQDGWSSDGSGAIAELNEVKLSERVDIQSRENPPFISGSGTSATAGTSAYLAADALTQDTHSYGKANINKVGLGFGSWKLVYGQLNLFKCNRTGVTDLVIPASGYTITHTVWDLAPAPGWKHQTDKVGAAVTVEGRAATAGGGSATSLIHAL